MQGGTDNDGLSIDIWGYTWDTSNGSIYGLGLNDVSLHLEYTSPSSLSVKIFEAGDYSPLQFGISTETSELSDVTEMVIEEPCRYYDSRDEGLLDKIKTQGLSFIGISRLSITYDSDNPSKMWIIDGDGARYDEYTNVK